VALVASEPLLSERDRALTSLAAFESPFTFGPA